ncbi:MAG: 30S ribosomal protein S6 [Bacteroidales bacterium]|nr:30S ribosomal protein S6 [Bacteroidales bacterium]
MFKQYETVFIATPVLSEAQMKEAVAKYANFITDNGGKIVCQEDWGLKKLAYPIQKKTTGFYTLIEFQAEPEFIARFETQFKRDERILRFQTVSMDKHAIAYAERRRAKLSGAAAPAAEAPAEAPANE